MGKKKTKTTTHQVTTPNNPTWVTEGLQGLQGKIQSTFNGLDPTSLVAGPDPLQLRAAEGAAGLGAGVTDVLGGLASKRSIDGLGDYMSPYLKDVVDTSLSDYDYGAGQTRAQDLLARAGDTTFGGSGGAIQTALSNDALTRGRASLAASLRDRGFTTALGASAADLARQAQAATALGAEQRANLGTQMDIGSILQQIAQARAQAPITALGTQTALTAGLPYQLFQGSTTDGTGTQTTSGGGLAGALGGLGSLAQGLGAMGLTFSDRRLKTDIEKIGKRDDGLGVYMYRYKGRPEKHVGVMAQEVKKVKPQAVAKMPNGYMAVDYGAL